MAGERRENAGVATEPRRLRPPEPLAGRTAAGDGGDGRLGPGYLGLRHGTGRDDPHDVRRKGESESDLGALAGTRSDGAGKPQSLARTRSAAFPWSFAPDGRRLAYFELDTETAYDLWTVPLENDGEGLRAGKPEIFLRTSS